MTETAKQQAARASRKGKPIERERTRHEGETYGYIEVLRMLGAWTGAHTTMYAVRRLCCGSHSQMTHAELTNAKSFRSRRCARCAGDPSAVAGAPAQPSGGSEQAAANKQELQARQEQQALERAAAQTRVQAYRARAEAARVAAYRRELGHGPEERPDWDAPLPIPVGIEHG